MEIQETRSDPEFSVHSAQPARPPLSVQRVIDASTRIATFTISIDPHNPPDVFFDTNVWIGMSTNDVEHLRRLRIERGFRYRYSVTNYVELISRLARGPSPRWNNPFTKVRAAFRRIHTLCDPEVLPSPESEYLASVDLIHCIDSRWVSNPEQTALAVRTICNADTLGDITGTGIQGPRSLVSQRWIVDPTHYLHLTSTDERSLSQIIATLDQFVTRPFRREDVDQLIPWFVRLATFFLLVRPSSGRVHVNQLSPAERNRFVQGFTHSAGRMFQSHITLIAFKNLIQVASIDPNDLYDALQLLQLQDENRLFVTNERSFFRYQEEPAIHRVAPWESFRCS